MAYPGTPAPRLTEGAGGTLPLLAYLALATVLMVADQRGGFASQARQHLSALAEPVWWLASSPGRLAEGAYLMHQVSAPWSALTSFMRCHLWWHLALFELSAQGGNVWCHGR